MIISETFLTILKDVCLLEEKDLVEYLKSMLTFYGYDRKDIWQSTVLFDPELETYDYIIARGDIPVYLVAHMDTVTSIQSCVEYSYTHLMRNLYDRKCLFDQSTNEVTVTGGCTLDDRLGIYAIIRILAAGYKPHIIFTNDEEIGAQGALELIEDFKRDPFKAKFIIELDRRGANDSVYYTCGNKKFHSFINSFGFKTAKGSFTDCRFIGEAWDLAAVNLSIGYLHEHSEYEYGNLAWTEQTIEKVKKILDEVRANGRNVPETKFKYITQEKTRH
jgi:hypothetical protein